MSRSKKRAKAGGKKGREAAAAVTPAVDAAAAIPRQTSAGTTAVLDPIPDVGRAAVAVFAEQRGRVRRGDQESYNQGRAMAVEWEQNLEDSIRRKPLIAVVVGLIVGFLIGRAIAGNG